MIHCLVSILVSIYQKSGKKKIELQVHIHLEHLDCCIHSVLTMAMLELRNLLLEENAVQSTCKGTLEILG